MCKLLHQVSPEIGEVELEHKIVEYARSKGTRILGPNIFGVYSASGNTTQHFQLLIFYVECCYIDPERRWDSNDWETAVENMGLSAIVSIGNKADIDEADCLEFVMRDQETKVILMYIEGMKEGERFMKLFVKQQS
jgi:acyl-CoA synthetase (NDP forming)